MRRCAFLLLFAIVVQRHKISLASDGDHLVVHNPVAAAVEVEITITED